MQDDELREVAKAMSRRLTTIESSCAELRAMLENFGAEQRPIRELDENGEPTWNYAIPMVIPKSLFLTQKFRDYALVYGHIGEKADAIFEDFKRYYEQQANRNAKNAKWKSWSLVLMKWMREQNGHAKKGNGGAPTRYDQHRTVG